MKFFEHLKESLADEIKKQPSGGAAWHAKRLNLKYMGFGRYVGKDGKVLYVVHDDKLVPFKGADVIQKEFSKVKNKPKEAPKPSGGAPKKPIEDPKKELNTAATILNKRGREDQKILKKKDAEVEKTHRQLSAFAKTQVFSDDEKYAIDQYMLSGAIDVNRYLYKGYDEGIDNQQAEYISKVIQHLDTAINQSEIPFDYSSYTGLSSRYNPEDFKLGGEYVFRGYVSTSLSHKTAIEGFAGIKSKTKSKTTGVSGKKVVLQIDHKKGQRGIYVSHDESVNSTFLESEKETILPRGTKLKIISGPHTMDGEVLGIGDSVILFQCKAIDE